MPAAGPDSPEERPLEPPERYASFVVRWRRAVDEHIELEHIQSGDRTRVSTASRAIAWMRHRVTQAGSSGAGAGAERIPP